MFMRIANLNIHIVSFDANFDVKMMANTFILDFYIA